MRFTDFLKATVLICAAAASALAAVTVAGAVGESDSKLVPFSAAWWVLAGLIGLWLGRRAETNPPIARLLAGARTSHSLPDLRPGRTLLNRLWPLLICVVPAGAVAFIAPQVAAIAAGFTILWALHWRRQEAAVSAIEDRDGVAFYIEPTSPVKPIQLLRTPGFKATHASTNGAGTPERTQA